MTPLIWFIVDSSAPAEMRPATEVESRRFPMHTTIDGVTITRRWIHLARWWEFSTVDTKGRITYVPHPETSVDDAARHLAALCAPACTCPLKASEARGYIAAGRCARHMNMRSERKEP